MQVGVIVGKAAAFLSQPILAAFGAGAAVGAASTASNKAAHVATFFGGASVGGVGGYHVRSYARDIRQLREDRKELARLIAKTNADDAERGQAITILLEAAKDDPARLGAIREILDEVNNSERPTVQCVVCLEEATHAFPECGHMCMCEGCAHHLMSRVRPVRCPMCRAEVGRVIRIFTQ